MPSLLEADPVTGHYHFPAVVDVDATSASHVAARRRGRFVIKLAAALYLAQLPHFDTPAKCTTAMSYLWGHERLGLEYLRRSGLWGARFSPAGAPPTFSPQQINVAESRWKARLGEQVLRENGFLQCWDDLVPFFRESVQQLECDEAQSAKTPLPDDATALAPKAMGSPPSRHPSAAGPTGDPVLDLAKVPARALSILYEKTVRHLRLVTPARCAVGPHSTPAQQHLASRGWLRLSQILTEVHTDLETEPTLKVLWVWMAALSEAQQHALFLALLRPMNVLGKLQLLHDASALARLPAETARASHITHLRAAWGHKDADVAAAVMREHVPVMLHSLAVSDGVDSGECAPATVPAQASGQGRQSDESASPASSRWFEFIEDTRMLRREVLETQGRLYPQHRPLQVLVPSSFIEALSAPLQSVRPGDVDTPAGIPLASLVQRTTTPAADASRVTYGELMALLQPKSGFCVTSFFAAVTGGASRFAFLPVANAYFGAQAADVQGWYMPQHMLRVHHCTGGAHRREDDIAVSAGAPATQGEGGVTAVAAPGSAMTLLVFPCALTCGVLQRSAAVPAPPHSSPPLSLPSVATVVNCALLYGLHHAPETAPVCVLAYRPETERVVSLRIASLWALWCNYGMWRDSAEVEDASGLRLMSESAFGLPAPLQPAPAAAASGPAPQPPACNPAQIAYASTSQEAEEGLDTVAPGPMVHHLPWEFFPAAEVETTLCRLDAACRAELHCACERWRSTCLRLLRPEPLCLPSHGDVTVSSGASHVDPATEALGPHLSAATVPGGGVPQPLTLREVEDREHALWSGLSEWIQALERACALPSLSLLLPPDVRLAVPSGAGAGGAEPDANGFLDPAAAPPPAAAVEAGSAATARRLCAVGRKKALATLRRLVSGENAPLLFYVDAEVKFVAPLRRATHRLWLVEPEADDVEAWAAPNATVGGASVGTAVPSSVRALSPTETSFSHGSRTRDGWTVAARRELVAAEASDEGGEQSVGFYVRLPCVLQRPTAHRTTAVATSVDADYTTLRQSGVRDTYVAPLRLCRYARRRRPPGGAAPAHELEWQLEELATHAPRRYAHQGCRVTPLVCDEVVLGAAWPAELIVEHALLPPLREAIELFAQRRRAEVHASCEQTRLRQQSASAILERSAAALQAMTEDLRRELLLVLTDKTAMEQREFYGDALVDYCASVTTLSCRSASSNVALWRGGNITGSSTNASLAVGVLPGVLRHYWMSRRRVCNGKRLADSIESLFGAVAMAVWVHPLLRLHAAMTAAAACDACAPPDADLLVYVASALMELLSGGR